MGQQLIKTVYELPGSHKQKLDLIKNMLKASKQGIEFTDE